MKRILRHIQATYIPSLATAISCMACIQVGDPCPRGTTRSGDRCAIVLPDAGLEWGGERVGGSEVDATAVMQSDDASHRAPDFGARDPGPWSVGSLDGSPPRSSMSDAGLQYLPVSDAATMAVLDSSLACAPNDVLLWRDFHFAPDLNTTIAKCGAEHGPCDARSCLLAPCLQQRRRISSCGSCIALEVRCAAVCAESCSAEGSHVACRACACAHGCIEQFERCSGQRLDACRSCPEESCPGDPRLSPELILLLVSGGPVLP